MARELAAHMVRMPKNFLVLRIFQLVFAILVLGLTIFGVIVIALNSLCITIFTAIATAITTIYIISAQRCAPSLYNYWAILALEIFCLIFWLISFALVASDTGTLAVLFAESSYCSDDGYCYTTSSSYSVAEATFVAICGTAAGLGALEFIFFLISLVIFSVMLYRHRKNGGHSKFAKDAMPPPAFVADNEASPEKLQPQPQTYSTSTTPAPQEYYQPPQHVQQNTAYAGAPTYNGQQYQPVPQYPQQMPQQLGASPAPTYTTPVQSQAPQQYAQQ